MTTLHTRAADASAELCRRVDPTPVQTDRMCGLRSWTRRGSCTCRWSIIGGKRDRPTRSDSKRQRGNIR